VKNKTCTGKEEINTAGDARAAERSQAKMRSPTSIMTAIVSPTSMNRKAKSEERRFERMMQINRWSVHE